MQLVGALLDLLFHCKGISLATQSNSFRDLEDCELDGGFYCIDLAVLWAFIVDHFSVKVFRFIQYCIQILQESFKINGYF